MMWPWMQHALWLFWSCAHLANCSAVFGRQEGRSVQLSDAHERMTHPECRNTKLFNTIDDAECCDMYLSYPSVRVGQTWGNLPQAKQRLWDTLQCDELVTAIRIARVKHQRRKVQPSSHEAVEAGKSTYVAPAAQPLRRPPLPHCGAVCEECKANATAKLYSRIDRELRAFDSMNEKDYMRLMGGQRSESLFKVHIRGGEIWWSRLTPAWSNSEDTTSHGFEGRRFEVMYMLALLQDAGYDLPDVDFVVCTHDTCPKDTLQFAAITRTWKLHQITMPSFEYASTPSTETTVDRNAANLHMLLRHQPWARRIPKLVYRGAGWSHRSFLTPLAFEHRSDLDIEMSGIYGRHPRWCNPNKKQLQCLDLPAPPAEWNTCCMMPLPLNDQCRYQYVLHVPGVSASGRLRQQINCGSVVFGTDYRRGFNEFYYHMLEPGKHYVRLPFSRRSIACTPRLRSAHACVNGRAPAGNWTLHMLHELHRLKRNPEDAKLMIKNMRELANNWLMMKHAICYWYHLISRFAKLQNRHTEYLRLVRNKSLPQDATLLDKTAILSIYIAHNGMLRRAVPLDKENSATVRVHPYAEHGVLRLFNASDARATTLYTEEKCKQDAVTGVTGKCSLDWVMSNILNQIRAMRNRSKSGRLFALQYVLRNGLKLDGGLITAMDGERIWFEYLPQRRDGGVVSIRELHAIGLCRCKGKLVEP